MKNRTYYRERHRALDEALAEYLSKHSTALPSETSILTLLEWNHKLVLQEEQEEQSDRLEEI